MNKEVFKKIIKDSNLKSPEIFVYKEGVRCIYKGEWNGRQCLLKIIPKTDIKRVEKAKVELRASEIIKSNNVKDPTNRIETNDILHSGEDNSSFWFIREYFDGSSLSGTKQLRGVPLGGYDFILENYRNNKVFIINEIIKNVSNLQKIEISETEKLNTFEIRIKKNVEGIDFSVLEQRLGIDLSRQISFIKENAEEYEDSKSVYCMGDLVPSNIVITETGKLLLTDLEYFCIDNNTFDLSYLWLYLWRYPDWQAEILARYPKLNKNYFHYSILRILLPLFARKFSTADVTTQNQYKKHMWKDYLVWAGESYDKLTSRK